MNIHSFFDHYAATLTAAATGRRKFFSRGVDCPDFAALLAETSVHMPEVAGEAIYEAPAESPVGALDPAFYLAQWLGPDYPTLLYHHGNNERPFDFGPFSKNTFKHVILNHRQAYAANLIALRAPFHRSMQLYVERMVELRAFAAMLAASVRLAEALVQWSRAQGSPWVALSGASLGGWVANLHRAYVGSADFYAPIMAGAALDAVFLESGFARLTGAAGRAQPEALRRVLNFEAAYAAVPDDNVAALLMRHDAFIVYERQKRCYDPAHVTVLDKGHTTGALAFGALRGFLLAQLARHPL